ncbi:MAG: c-type cytochrome [Epsilonproteobacteria bacterium]|nr:c-type cytochrome [Campylobacterota bacterium]
MRKLLLILPIFLFALRYEPITPLQPIKYNKQKALFGKKLFFDTTFSADGTISCASCHSPQYGGADPRDVSVGVYGRLGNIQSPTVYNAVYNFRQFWNGRALDLKEQIKGPINNPKEMGSSPQKVVEVLQQKYLADISRIYHTDKPTFEMFQDAVAEFEKALVSVDSKFDKWLRNEGNLTKQELQGYYNFKKLGCITCHNGANMGGNSFQKIGVIHKAKDRVGDRYEITHRNDDKFVYKVPSLRNITQTAPYFHDASTKELFVAINKMAYYNLGLSLTDQQIESIIAFFKTLTGKRPEILDAK